MAKREYMDEDLSFWGSDKPLCPYCGNPQETKEIEFCYGDAFDLKECDQCEDEFQIDQNDTFLNSSFVFR